MHTKRVQEDPNSSFASMRNIRFMTEENWIETHGSGTLRKNRRLGFAYRDQYLSERIAFEFGWAFMLSPQTRVTFGTPMTEGDNHSITEAGWHIDRMLSRWPFREDVFEVKYIIYEADSEHKREGVGLFLSETSALFIPPGNCVFGIIAEYFPDKKIWGEAIPC